MVTSLAFVLRILLISTTGLEHYDEGVYALSGLGLADSAQADRLFPGQSRFSPLVFPALVAASFRLMGGASDLAALIPNVLLGTLSVSLLWWVGRRWFGPVAGLAAALLLATSELHIAMSRSALTDVTFTLLFLGAIAGFVEAKERDSLAWALVAGVVTGLAWNTKYHGWFALVVTGAGLLLLTLRDPNRRWRPYGLWAASAVVAALLYAPWVVFVSSEPGGYPALLEYQRSMLQGRWLENLTEQLAQLAYMDGPTSRAGFAAVVLIPLVSLSKRGRLTGSHAAWLLAALAGLMFLGVVGVASVLALFWFLGQVRRSPHYAGLVLTCWITLWFVAAPLYTPYLRLLLPFSVAVFAGAGAWLQMRLEADGAAASRVPGRPAAAVIGGVTMASLAVLLALRSPVAPWRPAADLRSASDRIAALVPDDATVIVIGQPEVAFYLRLAGVQALSPEPEPEDWVGEHAPAYIVEGVYARRAPKLRDALAAVRGRLRLLARYAVIPKDLRVLDDTRGPAARAYAATPDGTFSLTVYLLQPVGS